MPKAIIFGIHGQMGSYLDEFLTDTGYEVYGMSRDMLDFEMSGSCHIRSTLMNVFKNQQPDEIYNLSGKMFAQDSWDNPAGYMAVNGTAVLEILKAAYEVCPQVKFFQAGSAEVFDKRNAYPKSENSPRRPMNPYAISKLVAEETVTCYREEKGMFACTGIFFNAESPRRKQTFLAQKVAQEVVRVRRELDFGLEPKPIVLGTLTAVRDWGLASEYVEVPWRMLNAADDPRDVVIATGESHTCYEFVMAAVAAAGLQPAECEIVSTATSKPAPPDYMCADVTTLRKSVRWEAKTKFAGVVKVLVEAEMAKTEITVGN